MIDFSSLIVIGMENARSHHVVSKDDDENSELSDWLDRILAWFQKAAGSRQGDVGSRSRSFPLSLCPAIGSLSPRCQNIANPGHGQQRSRPRFPHPRVCGLLAWSKQIPQRPYRSREVVPKWITAGIRASWSPTARFSFWPPQPYAATR